ncbi:TonB-dependent receptor [Flavihumibacter petaseus]|uniref:Putative TonB-dependent receptor n=1 Tax=Flavihumibacter petaseus NBRC 106054 TaxID=1220578 RepID=A0A0E9MV80_9BACT|nr:TonB-dependent receptor [Flavihumibacter petaseus]GAO41346.1 putative TonB-dependent receptor [Flavihumibacter petaseus NBRC 106054]
MIVRKLVLLAMLVAAITSQVSGQDNKRFTVSSGGKSFAEFVRIIEAESDYHFYFDPQQVDTLVISSNFSQATLQEMLGAIFRDKSFYFLVDRENAVFITYQVRINPVHGGFSPAKAIEGIATDVGEKLKVDAESKIYDIGVRNSRSGSGRATVAGYVRDQRSGDPIVGATVAVDSPSVTVHTDQYGYYNIVLPRGRQVLHISSVGMTATARQIQLNNDGKLDVELQEYVASLKTVIVSAEKNSNTRNLQMGTNRLSIKAIRQVPVVFGEADVLKVVLALPGVTSTGEASNGFNVRGGSTDQNLILMSDATIYNPSHLFGFFSVFNPDVVKGVELYKAAIPEKYGGRLSSVLDIGLQDGNTKKWSGQAGIGPLTSKISIGGPVKKEKSSLMFGARATYSNWLMQFIPEKEYQNSKAGFYDANIRYSATINAKNALYITGYFSQDNFKFNGDTTYRYGNRNANFKWKHNFNNALNNVVTVGIDDYLYSVQSNTNPVNDFKLSFNIRQYSLRSDASYSINNKHQLSFGINAIVYRLQPGNLEPKGGESIVAKNEVATEQALETAIYFGDNFTVSDRFSVTAGIRYSIFNKFGPASVNQYVPGLPRDTSTITGVKDYSSGSIVQTWQAPEIRVGMRYALGSNTSVKLSFNTMQQYIHMLSNTVSVAPTDIWKLSDTYIRPQQGAQLSLGLYRNFKDGAIETSVEGYYKRMRHFLDYKSGAHLLMNHHIETDVINTKGKAYGVELLVKKNSGKLNGWFSYTYSRTFLQQDDSLAGERINRGKYYPASFDKPHNLNLIGNYRFSHRFSLSMNVVYTTGRPITLPIAIFNMGGTQALLYSERNQYRIPDYFRVDLSATLDGNHKVKQKTHNSWSFGVYNMLARQNPYSVYFVNEGGKIKGYQLSIFGTAIPFVTYNIKF